MLLSRIARLSYKCCGTPNFRQAPFYQPTCTRISAQLCSPSKKPASSVLLVPHTVGTTNGCVPIVTPAAPRHQGFQKQNIAFIELPGLTLTGLTVLVEVEIKAATEGDLGLSLDDFPVLLAFQEFRNPGLLRTPDRTQEYRLGCLTLPKVSATAH